MSISAFGEAKRDVALYQCFRLLFECQKIKHLLVLVGFFYKRRHSKLKLRLYLFFIQAIRGCCRVPLLRLGDLNKQRAPHPQSFYNV